MKKLFLLILFAVGLGFMEVNAQFVKTQLKVTVIDELGNFVEGAEIRLFANEEDFKKEVNPVGEKLITNEKGVAKFESLMPKVYYILVEKGDMNNWGGGVQTDLLKEKKVNKINIIIE